jgi:hypothetical protein
MYAAACGRARLRQRCEFVIIFSPSRIAVRHFLSANFVLATNGADACAGWTSTTRLLSAVRCCSWTSFSAAQTKMWRAPSTSARRYATGHSTSWCASCLTFAHFYVV